MRRATTSISEPSRLDAERLHGTGVVRYNSIPDGSHRARTGVRHLALRVAIVDECPLIVQGLMAMLTPLGATIEVHPAGRGTGSPGHVDVTLYDPADRAPAPRTRLDALLGDPVHGGVVGYSFNPPSVQVAEWLTRGCAGFVDKAAPAEKLMEVLSSVAARHPWAPQGFERVLRHPSPSVAWPGQGHGLSPRESEMICLITRGLTNEEICDRAVLSLNTVKSYIRSAYHKLEVSRRPEAVTWGVEHGMLDPTVRYVAAGHDSSNHRLRSA